MNSAASPNSVQPSSPSIHTCARHSLPTADQARHRMAHCVVQTPNSAPASNPPGHLPRISPPPRSAGAPAARRSRRGTKATWRCSHYQYCFQRRGDVFHRSAPGGAVCQPPSLDQIDWSRKWGDEVKIQNIYKINELSSPLTKMSRPRREPENKSLRAAAKSPPATVTLRNPLTPSYCISRQTLLAKAF